MPLTHKFANPDLDSALEALVSEVSGFFQDELASVVIHGSLALEDFAPGYSDVDFLAVVGSSLSEDDCRRLIEIRKPFRGGDHGVFGPALEGAFLPRPMLTPGAAGQGFWWGTSGERPWSANRVGWFASEVVRQRGIVIWGADIRPELPAATTENLLADATAACDSAEQHGRGGSLHSVDWLLTIARLLLWLREGRLSSKTEAADWGVREARGEWRELLPRARDLRLNPALADDAEIKRWLENLTGPIQQGCAELRAALAVRSSYGRSP